MKKVLLTLLLVAGLLVVQKSSAANEPGVKIDAKFNSRFSTPEVVVFQASAEGRITLKSGNECGVWIESPNGTTIWDDILHNPGDEKVVNTSSWDPGVYSVKTNWGLVGTITIP